MDVNPQLIQRNFESLSAGLKDVRAKHEKIEALVISKDAMIMQLNQKVTMLEQRVNIMFAKAMNEGGIA